jgi:UPF0755 protein
MPEPLDPQKYHILSDSNKKKLTALGFVFILILLPIFGYFYYNTAVHRPSQLDKELIFEIKRGDSVLDIARNLYQQSAVNSEFLFSLYVFLNRNDSNVQAGIYTIKAGTPIIELIKQFQHGVNDQKITFIEGWRVEEFARLANKSFAKIDYSSFVQKAGSYEGYLFPDTYYFDKEIQEDQMIELLRATFDDKTKKILTDENLKRSGLTKEQAVILASIVEREVNNDLDRPIVAGILLKRFQENMRIDADATTQYAVAPLYLCGKNSLNYAICAAPLEEIAQFSWWPKTLSQADLDYDSPFNTRKNLGLPPKPISNPGLSAIDAIINSKDDGYLYYLTDEYGKTHYAKTLEEHQANIIEFLQ